MPIKLQKPNKEKKVREKTTSKLTKVLREVKFCKEGDQFIREHVQGQGDIFFNEYLKNKISERKLAVAEVIKKSGISVNYAYNIINGDRKNPSRDKVIALCIASKMTFDETNRALNISKLGQLYPKDERDVRIAVSINKEIDQVIEINMMLMDHGLPPLEV